MTSPREQALQAIRSNIERSGRHLYAIGGGESPRYVYTIGLSERVGFELVLAGSVLLSTREVARILNAVSEELEKEPSKTSFSIEPLGTFELGPVHSKWVKDLLLGALDYYEVSEIPTRQVVPSQKYRTIDHPDLSRPYSPEFHPVWRWFHGEAPHPQLGELIAETHLDALHGYLISELFRSREDTWELYSGTGLTVSKEDICVVSFSTLLSFDQSLEKALTIPVGSGLFRLFSESGEAGEWQIWQQPTHTPS